MAVSFGLNLLRRRVGDERLRTLMGASPVGAALAGIGIGAVVALTIAGAGANVPEFVMLSRLTSRKVLAVFGGYIFVVAMTAGLLVELLVA